jgi:hypothetical protein
MHTRYNGASMTVIMGVNLSDRLYIAGDTRVSKIVDGKIVPQHDNVQKVEHLKNGILIASAGHAGLAKHVLNQLRKASFTGISVDAVRRNIESWIGPVVGYYWTKQGGSDTSATFIIGARSKARRRVLSRQQLQKMNEDILKDEEAKRQTLGINTDLFNAMGNAGISGNALNLNSNDMVLFSVSVSHRGVFVQDTKWGEYLVFGPPGLIKEDISPSQIARLEFLQHSRNGDSGNMLVTAFISSLVEKRKLEGVGSAVLVGCVRSEESYLITGAVYSITENDDLTQPFAPVVVSSIEVINDVVHRVDRDEKHPLMPVSAYESEDVASLYI